MGIASGSTSRSLAPGLCSPDEQGDRGRLRPPTAAINTEPFAAEAAATLVSELGLSPVMAAVLASRGMTDPAEAQAWLDASDCLAAGSLGEVEAAKRIAEALRQDRTIAVHGDYDCDGVCSTAVLTLALRALGGAVVPRVPERSDGYGLSLGAIDDLAATGASLLIAVDCGITAVPEVEHARSLGLEVVVVDHHRPRPDGLLPDALIVHPQLADPGALAMCATAVAVTLVEAVAGELGRSLPDLGLAELQALATVTDVMPLSGINRTIVREGLSRLGSTSRTGLGALLDSAGVDRASLTARHLGFTVGPRINAAGRVRAAAAALELLLTDDPIRADALAGDLEAANAERRSIQQQTMIAAEQQAVAMPDAAGWVVAGDGWHHGVVGIVAGSLAGRYHRPTVVLAVEGEMATGSARSVPGFDVASALDSCAHLLERHGGHAAAAGLTIRRECIADFTAAFADAVDRLLPEELRVPRVRAEARVAPGELTLALAEELGRLEPTGEGNPSPILSLIGVSCERPRRMGDGRHARFVITSGNSSSNAVAFDSRDRISVGWGEPAEIVGRLELNRWNGNEEPRFTVERAVAGSSGPVGVLGGGFSWLDRVSTVLEGAGGSTEGLPSTRRLDSSGRSASGLLAALADDGRPVVVVADVDRRLAGLEQLGSGFDVISWLDVDLWPDLIESRRNLVLLDPPATARPLERLLSAGEGTAFRAWGSAEVRFSLRAHEHQTDIEPRIRPFYAELRDAAGGGADGVLAALRGREHRPRPPRQVASMLMVLGDLGAMRVALEVLEVEQGQPTGALDECPALLESRRELEEGRRFLGRLMSELA
ncbi:MAG: single-stranded-DNA-specific exonuclease RecJ [Actinomycetes bacterium]